MCLEREGVRPQISKIRERNCFDSDVDVAVYLDDKNIKDLFKKRLSLIEEIAAVLKKTVEVVILNEAAAVLFNSKIISENLSYRLDGIVGFRNIFKKEILKWLKD